MYLTSAVGDFSYSNPTTRPADKLGKVNLAMETRGRWSQQNIARDRIKQTQYKCFSFFFFLFVNSCVRVCVGVLPELRNRQWKLKTTRPNVSCYQCWTAASFAQRTSVMHTSESASSSIIFRYWKCEVVTPYALYVQYRCYVFYQIDGWFSAPSNETKSVGSRHFPRYNLRNELSLVWQQVKWKLYFIKTIRLLLKISAKNTSGTAISVMQTTANKIVTEGN